MWNGLTGSKMVVTFSKAYLMPIVVLVWFIATFAITYITAVALKDVHPIWPYISDTGTFPPEACVFGQLLNTGSILMAVVIYLRYRHVSEMLATQTELDLRALNRRSLWLGLVASFGVSVVGNFQETNAFAVHAVGAVAAFGCGTVYQVVQSFVTRRMRALMGSRLTRVLRIALAATCSVCMVLCSAFGVYSMVKFDGPDITKWTAEHAGYREHLFSSITEWIIAVCTMVFIVTFSDELRFVNVVEPQMQLIK